MSRHSRDDIDKFFEYGIFAPKRIIYIGSLLHNDNMEESGTDYKMAEYAIKGIQYLDTIAEKPIVVFMNNLGGDEFHGMAIYDTIAACRSHITIVGMGHCMSMGSIILQAADTRLLSINCSVMIHDGTDSITGPTKSVERWAQEAKKNRKRMYQIYLNKIKEKNSKITLGQIEKMCEHDKIFNAQEAIDLGLADNLFTTIHEILTE